MGRGESGIFLKDRVMWTTVFAILLCAPRAGYHADEVNECPLRPRRHIVSPFTIQALPIIRKEPVIDIDLSIDTASVDLSMFRHNVFFNAFTNTSKV
mgnify:CR=1 FL=1